MKCGTSRRNAQIMHGRDHVCQCTKTVGVYDDDCLDMLLQVNLVEMLVGLIKTDCL